MMDKAVFLNDYREAFGDAAELPLVFWYSDIAAHPTEKINGCFFRGFKEVRAGTPVSLNADVIGCGGGKFYTGFSELPPYVATYVSLKEKYKDTPEHVLDFVNTLKPPRAEKSFLNFARIDGADDLEQVEGILFLATPDILAGLTTWAFYDTNDEQAVVSPFGSGCSTVVTQTILENRRGGRRTFIGFFDPSVRPHFEESILSYSVPMSRFREMLATLRSSSLFGTHAWAKMKERINRI